ncbi:MAG TPA: LLM class flavin-dependent oxidoreductase [Dehalococcoidia bacterium]|nr:LLM class flavin-dependent oxidoreductase [Dehalococcoidia bacterium]
MISITIPNPDVVATLEEIRQAEAAGVPAVWLTTAAAGRDALTLFAAAAVQTSGIKLGTSIIPTWPRHPIVVAQQAQVVEALAPGRLRVGVGPSSRRPMEELIGANWVRPVLHLREYVHVLKALLQTGSIDFAGQHFTAHTRIAAPLQVPILMAALRERAFHLAGEIADGAISWMCPWPYLEQRALPALKAGAAAAGRPAPPLIMHVPVCRSEDFAAVRAAANQQVSFYGRLPSYRAMFADAGFEAGEDLSDSFIEALVAYGSDNVIAERLNWLLAQGAGEIIVHPLLIGERAPALAGLFRLVAAANR